MVQGIKINYLGLVVAFTILASCARDKDRTIDSPVGPVVTKPDYEIFKNSVKAQRQHLKGLSSPDISAHLYSLLNDDIYFYWKGTPWDFNGTTQKPNVGSIACGYFITNTLSDLGFKIQRIKLAQAASSEMIDTLCTDTHRFTEFENIQGYLNKQPNNSVYIVGLDFHAGYILKDSTGSYFLHSNYINREGVIKEKIEESRAFRNTKTFMIGSLTTNKKLLASWIVN